MYARGVRQPVEILQISNSFLKRSLLCLLGSVPRREGMSCHERAL